MKLRSPGWGGTAAPRERGLAVLPVTPPASFPGIGEARRAPAPASARARVGFRLRCISQIPEERRHFASQGEILEPDGGELAGVRRPRPQDAIALGVPVESGATRHMHRHDVPIADFVGKDRLNQQVIAVLVSQLAHAVARDSYEERSRRSRQPAVDGVGAQRAFLLTLPG